MKIPTTIKRSIFRAYDIRGLAETELTPEVAYAIGRGFGTVLRRMYNKEHPTVAVGRDARIHGPALQAAMMQGLQECGCRVYNIGATPSPMNYFTIYQKHFDGGVQITASHNPAEYNGCKLQTQYAHSYSGDDLQDLYEQIQAQDFLNGNGSIDELDMSTSYRTTLANIFGLVGDGLKIVVDSGNGIPGPTYTTILKTLGAEVIELYTEPDGTFPNHAADPSNRATLQELQAAVTATGAHLGLAFDGDGDRVGLVDNNGKIRSADEILLLLAQDHLQRFPGRTVISTVSSSSRLTSEIVRWGGIPVMSKVGHSHVEHAMSEHNALLGGEQSGHFFCGENYYIYDDALVAALRILCIVQSKKTPTAELFDSFPVVYQMPEVRPYCNDDEKTTVIQSITSHFAASYPVLTLDGVRIDFGNDAWAGIRQSNTSPCISICIEARTAADLDTVKKIVFDHIATYDAVQLK